MMEQPERPGLLTWEPIFADVSRAGDLGYTTGPWEFRKNGPDDKEVAHGNYVTVWKKQADGSWKAVMDTGISNPPPAKKPDGLQTAPISDGDAVKIKEADIERERVALINRDREFSKSSAARGILYAYDAYLLADARVFRDDLLPMTGKRSARAFLTRKKGTLIWRPARADVSQAADLGYTFGTAELKSEGSGKIEHLTYVRIWKKRAGAWKVALDIMNLVPPAAGSR